MNLQQKIFQLGIALTPAELSALAEVEARLKAQAASADRAANAGLGIENVEDPPDLSGLGIDEN